MRAASALRNACALVLLGLIVAASAAAPDTDHRAWQHGIDLIRVDNRLLLVWGSAGNPPRPNPGGAWPHDVYYAWLDPKSNPAATVLEPRVLVSLPEAQEPPSVAINSKGTILMTTEDGEGAINQRGGMWDSSLRVLRKYPFMIRHGGHSGHVAAMGERFLVTYSEGWVAGGGFLNLGTGKDVLARMVNNDGWLGPEIDISVGPNAKHRDGWPIVAASDRNWLILWQRYPELTLQSALVSDSGTVLVQNKIADHMPIRYAYDVEFSAALGAYVIAGSSGDGGFISLVNHTGRIVKTQHGLPPLVSESRIVLGVDKSNNVIGAYPVRPRGVALVRISSDAIRLIRVINHPYQWDYTGTTGVFIAPQRLLLATTSTAGVRLFEFAVTE